MKSKNSLQTIHELPSLSPNRSEATYITQIGFLLKKHQQIISIIQWGMVSFYFFLLFFPFICSFFQIKTGFWKDLHIFSVFLFWGVGWPLILLSTMFFGRIWCGIFCPDGTLTETISHYGKQLSIPRWIRWTGWPNITFLVFTLALFFSGAAYQYQNTAILLALLTLGALLIGFLYGKGRRIWCMYLCPSNIIFTFLAKLAPFHFQVDKEKWNRYQGKTESIHCAPLIHIKQMESMSFCHACGRCNNYRNAVKTAIRSFDQEISSDSARKTSTKQSLTLLYGIIGLGTTLFLLSLPFLKKSVFNHPVLLLGITLAGSFLLGSLLWGLIWIAWKNSLSPTLSWQQLSLGLIPLAGVGLALGFTPIAFQLFQTALWVQNGLHVLQQILLLIALLFSIKLGKKMIFQKNHIKPIVSMITYSMTASLLTIFWSIGFWLQI